MPDTLQALTGKEVLDLVTIQLGGAANAHDEDDILRLINIGKDKVRRVVSMMREDYFVVQSQSSDATKDDYFAALSTSTREYTLPRGFLRIRFVECVTTGFEYVNFIYRPMAHPDFIQQRKSSTAQGTANNLTTPFDSYVYTISGKNKLVLAAYPQAAFLLRIWFERQLPDIEISEEIPEIIQDFVGPIADFVVGRLTLKDNRDAYVAWIKEWKDDLREIEAESKQRNIADPQVVTDFSEGDM